MDWKCIKWQTYALQRNYFLCENLLLKYCYNLYHRPTSCCFLDMRGLRGWAMQVDRTNMIIRIIVVVQHRVGTILPRTSGLLWMKYRSNFSWIDSVVLNCRRLCWSKHCGPISWIGAYIGVSAVMTRAWHTFTAYSLLVTDCALKRKVLAAAPAWLDGLALWPLRL